MDNTWGKDYLNRHFGSNRVPKTVPTLGKAVKVQHHIKQGVRDGIRDPYGVA